MALEVGGGGSRPPGPHKPGLWQKADREEGPLEAGLSSQPTSFPTFAHHSLSSSHAGFQHTPVLLALMLQPGVFLEGSFTLAWLLYPILRVSFTPAPYPSEFPVLLRPSHLPVLMCLESLQGLVSLSDPLH